MRFTLSVSLVASLLLAAALAAGWPAARTARADEPTATVALTPPAEPPATATETATLFPSDTPTTWPTETASPTATPSPEASPTVIPDTPTAENATATPAPPATGAPTESPRPPTSEPSPTGTDTPTALAPTAEPTVHVNPAAPTPTPTAAAGLIHPASTTLVIHQVYGGGGNAGAPYRHDFVELRSLGGAFSLAGWSLQYAPAAGSAWSVMSLSGVVPAGGRFLVQLASGGANGEPLPAPDAVGSLNLSASAGKVALVSASAALSGPCPSDAAIVDFVGYGASASCYEGHPSGGLGNAAAAVRAGAFDTNDNAADFVVAAPAPRLVSPTATPTDGAPTATPSAVAPVPSLTSTPTVAATPTRVPSPTPDPPAPGSVVVNEVVTDPQQDWSGGNFGPLPGNGAVGDPDELVELLILADGLDLTGWTIELRDGSDVTGDLTSAGAFQVARYAGAGAFTATRAGDRMVLGNVRGSGSMTNSVVIVLRDSAGAVIDQVSLGHGAPDGNAGGPGDEAVARRPDGFGAWTRQAATPGETNDSAPLPTPTPPAATATPTQTATPTPAPVAYPPQAVLINEVAWAGTAASASDEWIELHNPGPAPIPLGGWTLTDGGDLDLRFPAGLVLAPGGYLLLERSDDATVADIAADLIYAGGLSNSGETLRLGDPLGNLIDLADGAGGWPAGDPATFASMERRGRDWVTHSGAAQGHDAGSGALRGTPRGPNSALLPAPTPPAFPDTLRLNEFLPAPGDGADEFVEILNLGPAPVDLSGWQLDDAAGGSAPYTFPPGAQLPPGGLLVLHRGDSGLALNNDGDSVRLLTPDGRLVDEMAFSRNPGVNVSWARVPDGGAWALVTAPSPGASNNGAPVYVSPEARPASGGVPIGVFRTWPAGAWAWISGRVTVPAPLFGKRVIYLQDETGGLPVYLGRGDWPALVVGQRVTLLGHSRIRSGRLEFYSRDLWHVHFEAPDGLTAAPLAAGAPGLVNAANAGALVTVTGRVVKLESTAFWLDSGAGPVRVFFSSTTGLRRPKVARGDVWTVTGVVVEMAATKTRAAGFQLQPRFAADVVPVRARYRQPVMTETPPPTEIPPIEEPTATLEP